MSKPSWKPTRVGVPKGKGESQTGSITVEISVQTPQVKQDLEEIITADGGFCIKDSKDTGVPQLLILEIDDDDPEKTFSLVKTVLGTASGTEVFLTSSKTESQILLEAIRSGMKEFFPQPIQKGEVEAALERFKGRSQEVAPPSGEKRPAKIIAVFGGKGGVGTTSVAVNLAACLNLMDSKPTVALVDVNQHGGDVPLYLDLQTSRSFRDIGGDLSRLDLAFLGSVLAKDERGLHVLPSGYDDLSSGRLSPDCVEPTIKLLQSMFDFVVIDCGHVLEATTKRAMELASTILVVTQLVVPVVHRTKRVLDLLRGSGFTQEKTKLVVNRYASNDKEVLTETEEIVKHKASWIIPNDFPSAISAVNGGKPVRVATPRSVLAKAYHELALSFHHDAGGTKSRSFWTNWWKSSKGKRALPNTVPA